MRKIYIKKNSILFVRHIHVAEMAINKTVQSLPIEDYDDVDRNIFVMHIIVLLFIKNKWRYLIGLSIRWGRTGRLWPTMVSWFISQSLITPSLFYTYAHYKHNLYGYIIHIVEWERGRKSNSVMWISRKITLSESSCYFHFSIKINV